MVGESFYAWLQSNAWNSCLYEDLLADIEGDGDFPHDAADKDKIMTHLWSVNACREVKAVFEQAFEEYARDQQPF